MANPPEFLQRPFHIFREIDYGNKEQVISAVKICVRCRTDNTTVDLHFGPAGECNRISFACLNCGVYSELIESDLYPPQSSKSGFLDTATGSTPPIDLIDAFPTKLSPQPPKSEKYRADENPATPGISTEERKKFLAAWLKRKRAEQHWNLDERLCQLGPALHRWRETLARGGSWREIFFGCRNPSRFDLNMKVVGDYFEAYLINASTQAERKPNPDPLELEAARLWMKKQRAECTKELLDMLKTAK